jgi:glyoxylase-like metal-dependent hydrolase (beta-lactamase superfamily II)
VVLIQFLPLRTHPVFGEVVARSQEGRHVPRIVEQIAPGVYRVDAVKIPYVISVLLIRDGKGWVLVDTGRSGLRIQQALDAVGAGPDKLKRIYLTHHHSEHISGLPTIRWWAPDAELVTSEYEAQIISGERAPDPLSDPLSSYIAVRNLPTVPIDDIHTISEGYEFAGFRVISTPGHTGGHTSLLNKRHGLLFTADAFGRIPEIRVGVNDAISTDPIEARRSAEKLLKEEFSTVVFSHGKPVRGEDVKWRLRRVVNRYGY